MLNYLNILQVDYIAGFILLLVIFLVIFKIFKRKKIHKEWNQNQYKKPTYQHTLHEKQQIFTNHVKREEAVQRATFERRGLLNKGETFALNYIQQMLIYKNLPYYIYPQVPLLAFIQETTPAEALQLQKGLRPDFILTDKQQNVIAVIEINGNGHHDKFDRSKAMILNSVGIAVIDIDTNGWNKWAKVSYENHVTQKVDQAMKQYLASIQ